MLPGLSRSLEPVQLLPSLSTALLPMPPTSDSYQSLVHSMPPVLDNFELCNYFANENSSPTATTGNWFWICDQYSSVTTTCEVVSDVACVGVIVVVEHHDPDTV